MGRRGASRGWEFRIAQHFVLQGKFAGLAGFRRRVAADKTSKQVTDTINRGGCSTVAEALGWVKGSILG